MNVLFKILIDSLLGLLFAIDNVVYSFIPKLYRLLLYLANVDLVTNNVPVQALIQRVYILVGVFMLFRLSFSIMNYIINPDAFGDQAKGFTNLVKRVLIAIVLLVGIPWFFTEAYVIQNKILTSGILPRLVLGQSMDEYSGNNGNDKLEETIETSAKDVQFLLFGPFFSLNYASKSGELEVCSPSADNPTSNILGTSGMASNEDCMNKFAELMDNSKDVQASGAFLSDYFRYSENGALHEDTRQFESFGSLITLTLSNGDRVINYLFIASTLCGGYLVFLLLSFCIDIAARVIRLLFLQILSPVAVISSIDPTSSGDRLKEWARECVKVWASLFLRLLVIFLIIQLVRVISNSVFDSSLLSTNYSNSNNLSAWIYIFLILGVFQAAKSVPDLIEKATGIKMSGDLQLNPFKSLKGNVGVGLGIAGASVIGGAALGTVSGGLSGAFSAYSTAKSLDKDKPVLRSFGGLLSGGFTGGFRGGHAKGFNGFKAGLQSGGRIARRMEVRAATGGTKGVPSMIFERARDIVGASTLFESMEEHAKRYDDVSSSVDQMQQRIVDQLGKKNSAWKTVQANRARYEQAFKDGVELDEGTAASVNDAINSAYRRKQADFNSLDVHASDYADKSRKLQEDMSRLADIGQQFHNDGVLSDALYVELQDELFNQEQGLIAEYYDTANDEQLDLLKISARKAAKDAGFGDTLPDNWRDIGGSGNDRSLKSQAEHSAVKIRSEDKYNDARDRDKAIHSARTDSWQKR